MTLASYRNLYRMRQSRLGIAADFVLIVVAGLAGGVLARLLRLPLLVGYVLAGIFVGPHTAGPTVVAIHDIELLAEIGVALLLFSLGLEISFGDLRPVRRIAALGGPLQILLTVASGALGGIYALGMTPLEAAWFGAMVSVSSTMVVVKILAADGVTSTLASRVMIGLLVVQDLAVLPMLIILPGLARPGNLAADLARTIPLAALALAAVYALGVRLLPRLLRAILAWGSRELFLVAVVAIGVGIGYAAHAAGLSFALGAFFAGLILSESEFSHQALSDVAPLRDIFGLLFFVTVGMLFDPRYLAANLAAIAATVAAITLGKAAIIGLSTRAFGYVNHAPWIVGLGLAQIGEFSFVLARTGLSSGALSKPTYDLALTSTVLTMALAPLVSRAALPLGRLWQCLAPPRGDATSALPAALLDASLAGHVIVAGYGRTGRAVAHSLRAASIPNVVVEFNHSLLRDLQAEGLGGLWGDIARPEILHAAGIERARLLLITLPDAVTTHLAIERARQLNPAIAVIARASRERHLADLASLGVLAAVQPEFEGGVEMGRRALAHCEVEPLAAARITADLRAELYGERSRSDA